jgi:hypothetical protein
MEQRNPSHLPREAGSALVPVEQHRQPLLPYERQLIEVLGLSEQEYREFVAEVARKSRERPAGYEHIPDIRCAPVVVAIVVNLVVGAALTAISMLLAPKPPEPDEQKGKKLASQQGRTRFNNNVAFDSAPQLAQLGSRVPIPFGRYEQYGGELPPADDEEVGETGIPSGGMVVEPLLVWSRMLSNGSFQSLKVMAMIGQTGIEGVPPIEAVMIGGQPIANIYKSNYAFFWSSKPGSNRLDLSNLVAGDASPDGHFLAPSASSDNGPAFSCAYSPTNTASFGVYNSIRNGGHYRVNWRVISVATKEGRDVLYDERMKIAGKDGRWIGTGMHGLGRAYSTRMGITRINGTHYSEPKVVTVKRKDKITFSINGKLFTNDSCGFDTIKSGVNCDDINNTIVSMCEEADDLLRMGEIFLCNRTMLRVVERPTAAWTRKKDFEYELEVIGFTGANREIGVAGTKALEDDILSEGGDSDPEHYFRSTSWYPLHKVDIGQVANTRPVEVTELGISSNVWSKANGLCNFNSVPTPNELERFDRDEVQLQSGSMDKYMNRTSFFVLGIKEVGNPQGLNSAGSDVNDDDGLFDGFDMMNDTLFCVRGNRPVDIFNYIRIHHPHKAEYEFRLVPKDACNIHRYAAYTGQSIYVLNTNGPIRSVIENTVYGRVLLKFNALVMPVEELFELPELRSGDADRVTSVTCTVTSFSPIGVVGTSGGGYLQAYYETILGQLKDPNNPGGGDRAIFGETRTRNFSFTSGRVTFNCTMTGTVLNYSYDAAFVALHGTAKAWGGIHVRVVSTAGAVTEGAHYDDTRTIGKSWYAYWHTRSGPVTFRYGATGVTCTKGEIKLDFIRNFEPYAQIKEISVYSEISRSCDNKPEHRIVYINESLDCNPVADYYDLTMVGVKLRSLNQVQSFEQLQIYLKNGIRVTRLEDGQHGPTNNFADVVYWLLTQAGASIGGELSNKLIDKDSFVSAARFIRQTRLRFDGAITDKTNLRTYITQLAPLFLCNFVVKNGRFALVPAVPTRSDGEIDDGPVAIQQIFTDGNIIDGSFELNYLEQGDRQDFRAVTHYRDTPVNGLVQEQTIVVKWKEEGVAPPPQEDIDMSPFCTRRGHAFIAARYLLSVRRRIDHIVKFQTLADGLSLGPGDYIRVDTLSSPYESARNAVVRSDLTLLSPSEVKDGTYTAHIYREGSQAVATEQVVIQGNRVSDPTLANALLNIPSITRRTNVYMVDKLDLTEDGLVDITASHFPVFADGRSKIVDDILHANRYVKFEVIE